MPDRELRPVGRFEWEQIICRARFAGLITGNANGTRGGVSGAAFKAVAFAWATHANPDGTEIWPGDATLAIEAEVGLKVAKAVKAKMIELGLTERTRAGSRRLRRPDVYRLTLSADLLDHLDVLTPASLKLAAVAEYEKQRGKRGGSTGPLKDPIGDNDVQGPEDPQQPDPAEVCGGSDGPTKPSCGGSDGTVVGGPMDRDTTTDLAPSLPTPTEDEVRTALTGPRAPEAEQPDSDVVDEPLPEKCEHGIRSRRRPDGTASCALCRRQEARPTLARVIPIRSA